MLRRCRQGDTAVSRFDDLLKAKKLKPGEPDLSPNIALSKSKDPNFVRTTVYLPKQLHRQLKSALLAVGSGNEFPGGKVRGSIPPTVQT
jgi:hypothetical protein